MCHVFTPHKQTSKQQQRADDLASAAQYALHIEFQGLLNTVLTRPSLWVDESLRCLRNFCCAAHGNVQKFPSLMGDSVRAVYEAEPIITPTTGYIAAVASGSDTSDITSQPVLSVLSRQTGFQTTLKHNSATSHQSVKITHLTLVDGDRNSIHARLATHLADKGRDLEEGDLIRLEMFTELSYRVNDESPRMPAIFVIKYTKVGHAPMPLQKDIKGMIQYTYNPSESASSGEAKSHSIPDPLSEPPPSCTFDNRLCRLHGVNFIGRCICEEIPVKDRDLSIIAEDCCMITKPVSELENKPKRLMLYWWYATNIYSIRGKGNRGRLPVCLEYAIKKQYQRWIPLCGLATKLALGTRRKIPTTMIFGR